MTDVYHRTAFAGNGMMTWKGSYLRFMDGPIIA